MRFERRYEGITYVITIKPKADDKRLLRELKIEIYRKHASGDRHGFAWRLLFSEKELKVERYEDRHDWAGSYFRLVEAISLKADWIEAWWIDEVEETIRDLGVKDAAEHFLKHLRLIFDHPLSIPLRL
jgi:hypothetical protein